MKTSIIALLVFVLLSGVSNALNPSKKYATSPEKLDMKYKAAKVKTNDGTAELNTWYFPAKKKTTRLILISHNGEGNMGDYLKLAAQFTNTSNVMMYDYRGFGESSDFEIDNSMVVYPEFQNDLETMIDHCAKEHAKTFDLYGAGIGAGLSLGVGFGRVEMNKIIADTPFLSMEDLESRYSSWDKPLIVPTKGYDTKYDPITAMAAEPGKNLKSIKLIVGSNDALYKNKDMELLMTAAPKFVNKDIYVVENPDKKDNFSIDEKAYAEVMQSFLKD